MTLSRLAPWLIGALLASCVALWGTADSSSGEVARSRPESRALDQLAAVVAAHGHTIPDGQARYTRVGEAAYAHGALDGVADYTSADFEAGVLIMALLIDEPTPGRVPNGAYVVQVRFEPGSRVGVATYFDAQGRAAAAVTAYAHTPDELRARFPAYATASRQAGLARTHVWEGDHHAVECAGWQPYSVISY